MKPLLLATLMTAITTPMLGLLPNVAAAADGQLEINVTCATQTGCFPGDTPGYPVRITQSGAYRLTSSLIQNQIPGLSSVTTAVEIMADGVDLDVAGFTIGCSNPLGGLCTGDADGIFNTGGAYDDIRVANGRVSGMPGDGLDLGSADGAVIENVRVTHNRERGIAVGAASRVADCTVIGSGYQGIFAVGHSVITHNVVRDSGLGGISSGSGLISHNTVADNGGDGISTSSAVVQDNQVASNTGTGIRAAWQSRVVNNVVLQNGGFGLVVTNSAYEGNHLNANAGGTVSGGLDMGGNSCNFTAACP